MKTYLLLTMALLISTSISFSQGNWISFNRPNPNDPTYILNRSDNSAVNFAVELPGMFKQDTIVNDTLYQRLLVPGLGVTNSIAGNPELPYIRKMIAIPECDSVSISFTIANYTVLNNYLLYPYPNYQSVDDTNGTSYFIEIFEKNYSFYQNNVTLPSVDYQIKSIGHFRSQRYLELIIYPMHYNPVTKQLTINYDFEINIDFINSSGNIIQNTGIFNNVASHVFINYPSNGISALINDQILENPGVVQWITLTDTSQAKEIIADYLIITDDQFFEPNDPEAILLNIANHRAEYNGFNVAIVDVMNILSLDFYTPNPIYQTEQKIRTFIKRVYEGNHGFHILDGKLGYVLLVGDANSEDLTYGVPTSYDPSVGCSFFGDPYPNDYYYSCITEEDGIYDEVGDLLIGRFSVQNESQLSNAITKTTYYETEYTFEGWRKKLVHYNDNFWVGPNPSHMSEAYSEVFYTWLQEDIMPQNYDLRIINAWETSTMAPAFDSINSGCFIGSYQGHGSESKIGSVYNTFYHHNHLNNNLKNPFTTFFACATGAYDDPNVDCIAEDLIRYSGNLGYVGILAAGRPVMMCVSYWIGDPPLQFHELVWYSIFENLNFITGEFILESKLMALDYNMRYKFQLLGDPALNIMAAGYEITKHVGLLACDYEINNKIFIRNGGQVSFGNCDYYLRDQGQLIVDEGGV